MNNILTIKIFGDIDHQYGPYFRIGYRDKEATFNLLGKDRLPINDNVIEYEMLLAAEYTGYPMETEAETERWVTLCRAVRDLYIEVRKYRDE